MSLRSPHAVVVGTEGHECRLARVLGAGQQQQKAKTTQRQSTRTSVDQCIDAAIRRAGHSSRIVPTSSVVLSILGPPTPKPPPHKNPEGEPERATTSYLPTIETQTTSTWSKYLKQYWVVSLPAIHPPAVLLLPTTYLPTFSPPPPPPPPFFFFFFFFFSPKNIHPGVG